MERMILPDTSAGKRFEDKGECFLESLGIKKYSKPVSTNGLIEEDRFYREVRRIKMHKGRGSREFAVFFNKKRGIANLELEFKTQKSGGSKIDALWESVISMKTSPIEELGINSIGILIYEEGIKDPSGFLKYLRNYAGVGWNFVKDKFTRTILVMTLSEFKEWLPIYMG